MNMRNLALLGVVLFLLIALVTVMTTSSGSGGAREMSYSEFQTQVDSGRIKEATIKGNKVTTTVDGQRSFAVFREMELDFASRLQAKGVNVKVEDAESGGTILSYILSALPLIFIIGLWFFLMRQMQGGGGRAMSFGKSKARLLTERHGRVTFDDVAGVDEAKEELEEIVDFLKDPSKFQRLGGKIPKGALLVGPPGTGKTLIARAVAGEANVPFFTISGSDFVEMFVGVGASRVRDMFEQAKKNAPCIIFIDEIDAVGRHRGAGLGGGNDEREQTLNQLLVEMDGFEANEGIIIIAATNRPDVLDPALLRPGRFDRQVTVGNPDIIGPREDPQGPHAQCAAGEGRRAEDDCARHARFLRRRPCEPRQRSGASGRPPRQALGRHARVRRRQGQGPDGTGTQVHGHVAEGKELTAWHEAGHAIVAMNVPSADPVHKATIIPRGRALGMVMQLPTDDKLSMNKTEMISRLAILMGGRVAEELKFGADNVTAGAASDIQQATRLARAMITRWGFSDSVGPVDYAEDQGEVFLGNQLVKSSHVSEETSRKIEEEVRKLVVGGIDDARRVLTEKRADWVSLAEALLEYETLSGEEITALVNGKRPDRPDDTPTGPTSAVPVIKKKPKGDEGFGGAEPEPQPG
jgi:cell division protease FtsH